MTPLDLFNRIHRLPAGSLSATEQAVILALLSTVDSAKGYTGWATQAQLAQWSKLTDRTVRNMLTRLEARGIIAESVGGNRAHTFTLRIDALLALSDWKDVPPGKTFHPEPDSASTGTTFRVDWKDVPPEVERRSDTASLLRPNCVPTVVTPEEGRTPEPSGPNVTHPTADSDVDLPGWRNGRTRGNLSTVTVKPSPTAVGDLPVVVVGDRELPGDLPALLSGIGAGGFMLYIRILVAAGVESTERLLRVPAHEMAFMGGGKDGLNPARRDALAEHLRSAWGVEFGALATAAPVARAGRRPAGADADYNARRALFARKES